MTTKDEVNAILKTVMKDRLVELWWDLRIPGLGMVSPGQVWETDPERVLEYAKSYTDTSFS